MKFRLISRQGVDEGTGEISDAFAGPVEVLVWAGRTFQDTGFDLDTGTTLFREVLGQALDHHQVTPPPKVAERWTSPTAIGRMAEKAPDVIDSVAAGYVYLSNPAPPGPFAPDADEERFRWDIVDCSGPTPSPGIRRRRGEPS